MRYEHNQAGVHAAVIALLLIVVNVFYDPPSFVRNVGTNGQSILTSVASAALYAH
jgi:hypothetical protein